MTKGAVDVVWRGLDAAAVTRLSQQVQQSPDEPDRQRLHTRRCSPAPGCCSCSGRPPPRCGPNRGLRQAIAAALQGDRTSDSVVPGGVPGHLATFPLGGKVKPKVTWKNRINLTLGYDPSTPNGQDIATQIRTRLENTGGLSVQLRPGEPNADLTGSWTARRGPRPRWPGCSPISTPRCPPSATTVRLDRDRVPQDQHGRLDGESVARRAAEAGRRRPDRAADQPVRRARLHPRRAWRCPRRPTARAGSSACSASAMADARELSGVRTGDVRRRRADHLDRSQGPAAFDRARRGGPVPHHQGRGRPTTI